MKSIFFIVAMPLRFALASLREGFSPPGKAYGERGGRSQFFRFLAGVFLFLFVCPEILQAQSRGILGESAPGWGVDEWAALPENRDDLHPSDFRGKVVYVYAFQSWCPGCHRHGFPTLRDVREHFRKDENVAFVAIQTVFEGYGSNTFERGREVMEKFDLDDIPMGQSGAPGERSEFMGRYRSGGTPWTVIIAPSGEVVFNDFHIDVADAISLIEGHSSMRRKGGSE